ncbi:hydroxypyruvate isomerase [Aquamicrobium terrae]|uniref:Hydroxypyruvate isomerase n=1 Tax=Aquamicrobium terrae TaxID=1324945 RepID=A0ABV2MUZ9_9HYPH
MPRFSANLSMLFNEYDFLDRFEAAARAGFKGVEYLGAYDHFPEEVAARLTKNGLTQVLFNVPSGDWAGGERGIAILPGRVEEFQAGVDKAITYAKALGCGQVNCLAGIAPAGASREELEKVFVENLKFAADKLGEAGVRLLIEPINTRDIPGFFLTGTQQALDLIEKVGSQNLYLQYDIYHMQIMEGDLARTIEANLDCIAHIQLADNPGRHEPGTGEINYPFLYDFIDRLGYSGWIGAEYKPKDGTEAGLGWLRELAAKDSAAA